MRIVTAGCRYRLTESDLQFILDTLSLGDEPNQVSLLRLLESAEERDRILDSDLLYKAVIDSPEHLTLSPHLYFYILVRHAFRKGGLDDVELADYVAAVLVSFVEQKAFKVEVSGIEGHLNYSIDLEEMLRKADQRERFFLHTFAANQFLFLTGLFAEFIAWRQRRRGAPGVKYYEQVAISSFRSARDHFLAKEFALREVFDLMTDALPDARRALNDCSERLLHLD